MTQSTTRQWSTEKLLLVVGVIAVVAGAAIGISVGYAVRYEAPTTRTFYLFNSSLNFDEGVWGVSHDTFSPDRITVNKADKVVIIYRNIEDHNEDHTFTMLDTPYKFDAVVHVGRDEATPVVSSASDLTTVNVHQNQTAVISFTASWGGVFEYRCIYHYPTMTGYLVVLG